MRTTKITLENEDGVYSVETFKADMTVSEVMDDLVRPVLLAAGYHPDSIARYFEGE